MLVNTGLSSETVNSSMFSLCIHTTPSNMFIKIYFAFKNVWSLGVGNREQFGCLHPPLVVTCLGHTEALWIKEWVGFSFPSYIFFLCSIKGLSENKMGLSNIRKASSSCRKADVCPAQSTDVFDWSSKINLIYEGRITWRWRLFLMRGGFYY